MRPLSLLAGSRREGAGLRHLGARLARLAVLHARHHPAARALARQPAVAPVRGSALEGRREDGDEAASREPLRPGAARGGTHGALDVRGGRTPARPRHHIYIVYIYLIQ